ncbi:MAG: tetratricopeptide repeat protein [Ferrovum sp.]|nr:tetratricopeptide repeat protein [Ferrovum sp.]NDU86696.1 tetratricopeptide repeat protein [Ferrovum sp.]
MLLPDEDDQRFHHGVRLLRDKEWDQARILFEALLRRHPAHPLIHANQALVQEHLGHGEAARSHHQQAIEGAPQSSELRFNWANFLRQQGSVASLAEAQEQYLAVLMLDPQHLGAWINLGNGLFETGRLSAAKTAFQAALSIAPQHPSALLNLAQVALNLQENHESLAVFDQVLTLYPNLLEAHRGLATCASRLGLEEKAQKHRLLGYGPQPVIVLPGLGQGPFFTLLILASAQDGNIPWQPLLQRQRHHTTIVAVEFFPPATPLPPHDCLFNAIGDADRCASSLMHAQTLLTSHNTRIPLINAPERIEVTGRTHLASLVHDIPHVATARTEPFPRSRELPVAEEACKLEAWIKAREFTFPLLLRAPGFHGGQYFERAQNPSDLDNVLRQFPGDDLLVMESLSTQTTGDGLIRKFRVMMLGGRLYPIHLAFSFHWKVHYFSSLMSSRPDLRAEEQRFLNNFAGYLGPQAVSALKSIQQRLGLDYGGMDFALDAQGGILLFEANATMVLHPPPDDPIWDYRRPSFEQALKAARNLIDCSVRPTD